MMDQIEPGLYLGNIYVTQNACDLENAGITHLLSVINLENQQHVGTEGILHHMRINAEDDANEDLISHFEKTNEFIKQGIYQYEHAKADVSNDIQPKKGGVLVHCGMGISRSATVVAAYLMQKHKISSTEAIERMRKVRMIVSPNPGFVEQLDVYSAAQYDVVAHPEPYMQWIARREQRLKDKAPTKPPVVEEISAD